MSKPLPPVAAVSRPPLSRMDQVYLLVLRHWYAHRTEAPTILDIVGVCKRNRGSFFQPGQRKPRRWPSATAVRSGLLSLESKGYTKRNEQGRFEVCE